MDDVDDLDEMTHDMGPPSSLRTGYFQPTPAMPNRIFSDILKGFYLQGQKCLSNVASSIIWHA